MPGRRRRRIPVAQIGLLTAASTSILWKLSVVFVSASLCVSAAGCQRRTRELPSVLLISIDTLRADHLSCYGYTRETSPHLDAFARNAALFENAYAQAPFTLTSHMSIFTSLVPTSHGVSEGRRLSVRVPLLAEVLKDADRVVLAERLRRRPGETALIDGRYKLVGGGSKWRLFDLVADPGETHSLHAGRPGLLRTMRGKLTALSLELRNTRDSLVQDEANTPLTLDQDAREELRALGYLE